jgi:serine phosphatase RsbU (regulator of sigma subunit)
VPGQIVELHGERTVLGRHPNCQIVLDDAAVSRHHAQILESHGVFYLEDLRSRNHTYLNGTLIETRTELHEADEVKVCGVLFRFHKDLKDLKDLPAEGRGRDSGGTSTVFRPGQPTDTMTQKATGGRSSARTLIEPAEGNSSIIGTVDIRSDEQLRLGVKPEVKLRAVLKLSNVLARVIALDDVLHELLEGLFQVFPQAQHGVVLLRQPATGELEVRSTRTALPEPEELQIWSRTVVKQAVETGRAILSADAASDEAFKESQSVSKFRIHSTMCVPLLSKDGESLGAIQIVTRNVAQRFSQDDLDLLASMASQARLAVENAYLHEEVLRQRDVQRDLEVATQIQLGFLPNKRPRVAGYSFYDYYEPAQSVGGDYFDYVPLPEGRVAIAVADVAGKGVPAALLMARLYSTARYQLLTHATPSEAMAALNREMSASGLGFRFITAVVAVLDPERDELTLSNAGHPPPLVRHADGTIEPVSKAASGLPLGVMPEKDYPQLTIPLAKGETVLLFTDGITEAMNPSNSMYGTELLSRFLSTGPQDTEELVKAIVRDVEQFCEGRPQSDDMCLVALKRLA